jgi:hypothetical protein
MENYVEVLSFFQQNSAKAISKPLRSLRWEDLLNPRVPDHTGNLEVPVSKNKAS